MPISKNEPRDSPTRDNPQYVLVGQFVIGADLLFVVFRTRTADAGEAEPVAEFTAEIVEGVVDGITLAENERLVLVDATTGFVHVDPDQAKFVPDPLGQRVETLLLFGADEDTVVGINVVLTKVLVDGRQVVLID